MATILVVDDEPDIRYYAQVNLELDGHQVLLAANGAEALAQAEAHRPDVILLDVMMPGVDGWSVLESLKANLDLTIKQIPVLMLTALSSDQDHVRGGIEGAIRYLTKPVSPEQLRVAIEQALAEDEPSQRRRAQHGALEKMARIEKGGPATAPDTPRPRLTKLEHVRPAEDATAARPARWSDDEAFAELTKKQRELLEVLRDSSSVTEAATRLGVSRSNIYASLRRVGRKLGVSSVTDLLRQLRAGSLGQPPT
jgi:CheY-like chemotaxis protein/DNA-binding CsgD family transcriptional regulator